MSVQSAALVQHLSQDASRHDNIRLHGDVVVGVLDVVITLRLQRAH